MAMRFFREGRTSQSDDVLKTTCPISFVYFYSVIIINIKTVQARTHTNKMIYSLSVLVM